ncbi:MAG: type II toxin-antitoxin system RelE/ParE family toxin [Alphaproteobacteria bacterium]|nr:type II toxin-antitoxin system RelE/ParE family toxin [Alphaproteobacteria bacterium]
MIKGFADETTESIFRGNAVRRVHIDLQRAARRKLRMIDAAPALSALRVPPANELEALKGGLKGFYSIRVNKQWRIIFRFENGDAYEVRFIDYH